MTYYHGIRVQENTTSLATPLKGNAGPQVIFGTAPINMAEDPYYATNQLFLIYSFPEAVKKLGYLDDYEKYTLCQSMDACFKIFTVAPIVLCNVLDPIKHRKENEEKQYQVNGKQAIVDTIGILLDTLTVKKEDGTELIKDIDYIATFDEKGEVILTLLPSGNAANATTLTVKSSSIDPEAVTENDIIGGLDVDTGKESGLELIRKVYPKFGLFPGLILAPGWSNKKNVGAVMDAKCTEINGAFSCENVLDLDTEEARKYTDCAEVKERNGYESKQSIVLWPKVKAKGKIYAYSAIYGAMVAHTDINNDSVPSLHPSNQTLNVEAAVLADGTEVDLDQPQANILNSQGIVTTLKDKTIKSWGNNTAIYPKTTDPKDRWIGCRRFFSWWGNSFITIYKEKVDNPANYQLIESIVDAENVRGNSYVQQGKCAGIKMEYNRADNPIEEIMNGKIQFKQYLAPYPPAEDILNVLEFDPSLLERALGGD